MDVARPLITHLGLGDGIIQAGAVVVLGERYGKIAVPCYEKYRASTQSFYAAYPNISIYTLPIEGSWGSPPEWVFQQRIRAENLETAIPFRAGIYTGTGIDEDFSQSFYRHLDVPYSARWDRCPLGDAWPRVEQVKWPAGHHSRIFMHDDPLRGYKIRKLVNRANVFRPNLREEHESILRYVSLILSANEIHVIDSAFFHLVNSFNPRGRLFLHKYPRWPRSPNFRYPSRLNWQYVS